MTEALHQCIHLLLAHFIQTSSTLDSSLGVPIRTAMADN
jgi:hypothetical protein